MTGPPEERAAPTDEVPAPVVEVAAEEQRTTPRPSETIGTGSALGIGCLLLMVLLILAAVVFRWGGVSW